MSEASVPAPTHVHGEIVGATQAYCDLCRTLKPLPHFEPSPFIEEHPAAARGLSARDLREWQRGWGGDGHSGHRALRLQVDRRSRTTRALALAGLPEGRGWDGVVELELATRPNVLDTVAKGVRPPKV